jgi:GxxExxY protein
MLLHQELTDQIMSAFYKVYNCLGHGFLEKVYENAVAIELERQGHAVRQQQPIKVFYEGHPVGDYFADLIIDDLVILQLKAAQGISEAHETQLLNYLRATDVEVGLLLNFGTKPQFRRKVYMNDKNEHPDAADKGELVYLAISDPRESVQSARSALYSHGFDCQKETQTEVDGLIDRFTVCSDLRKSAKTARSAFYSDGFGCHYGLLRSA